MKKLLYLSIVFVILLAMPVFACDVTITNSSIPYLINTSNIVYCLGGDIGFDNVNAINFTVNDVQNVTLDCRGYYMKSNDYCVGSSPYYGAWGILFSASNLKNITVKNCIIKDYCTGVGFKSSLTDSTFYNNTFESLPDGGIENSDSAVTNGLKIVNNTFVDVDWMGANGMITLWQSNYVLIENNTIVNGGRRGMYLYIANSVIKNNFVNCSTCFHGIFVSTSGVGGLNVSYENNVLLNSRQGLQTGSAINSYLTGGYSDVRGYEGGSYYDYDLATNFTVYDLDFSNNPMSFNVPSTSHNMRYSHDSGNIWMMSNGYTSTNSRQILDWNSTYIRFTEDSTGNVNYTITNLKPDTTFEVYRNSTLIYTLDSDLSGNIPTFNISFSSVQEILLSELIEEQRYTPIQASMIAITTIIIALGIGLTSLRTLTTGKVTLETIVSVLLGTAIVVILIGAIVGLL